MKTIRYVIDFPGERAAGLHPFSDRLSLIVDSGEPGGEPGEFEEWIRQALVEWYDGPYVTEVKQKDGIYFCVCCGSNPVDAENGFDTCNACLEKM